MYVYIYTYILTAKMAKIIRQGPKISCGNYHRITEWLRLAGTSGGHLVLPPCLKQDQLAQVDQGCVQPDFENLPG